MSQNNIQFSEMYEELLLSRKKSQKKINQKSIFLLKLKRDASQKNSQRLICNTQCFDNNLFEANKRKHGTGFYIDAPKGSIEYKNYWNLQKHYCENAMRGA